MTLVERKGTTTESPTKMQLLEKYLVGGYVIVTALLLLTALAQYVWPTPALAASVRALYLALVLVSLGYLLRPMQRTLFGVRAAALFLAAFAHAT